MIAPSRGEVAVAAGALWIVAGCAGASLIPAGVHAQDLEVSAELAGRSLPEGYWERKAADPLAFELPNGLFGGRSNLPPVRMPGAVGQPARQPYLGTHRFPVVLALFADSPEPWVTPDQVRESLFTGPAPRGTLKEFYEEASYGAFSVDGVVSDWIRTGLTLEEVVGADSGLGGDARVGEYMIDALTRLDDAVDFGEFDNDGPDGIPNSGDDDGIVDVVTFEFLEAAATCGGPAIWPHRWGISGWTGGEPWVSNDPGASGQPIVADGYIIQGATRCGGAEVQTAATIAHEYGHVLGLPDYYHPVGGRTPEFRRWVLGCWDLMAAGSWGCGPVGSTPGLFGPTHMTSWNRYVLGWLDYREVGEVRDTVVELRPIRTSGDALRVPLQGGASGEALLLELRDQGGFDADLPASGILVTHLNPDGERRPQTGRLYYLSVLEADGVGALTLVASEGGDRGSAGDVWGTGDDLGFMNSGTSPGTRTAGGLVTPVAFHSLVAGEGGASVHLSTHPEPSFRLPDGPFSTDAGATVEAKGALIAGGFHPLRTRVTSGAPPGLEFPASAEWVWITGVPLEEGSFVVQLEVEDARGVTVTGTLELVVGPLQMELERLLDAVLGGAPLQDGEVTYLDAAGNGNGILDVGDARAWYLASGGGL